MISDKDAAKVLTVAEQEAARHEAELLEAQQVSETESAFHAFLQNHVGQHGLLSNGTGKPDPTNIFWNNVANKTLLLEHARRTYAEGVTPATLERSFQERKHDLASVPRSADPEGKSGERKSQNGNERNLFRDAPSRAAQELRTRELPIPHTRHQLLEWSGQISGTKNLDAFRAAVRKYGSRRINEVLLGGE